jgi:hypothetical protein
MDLRAKGGIAIYVRENLDVVDIYKSELYELICLTLRLPSGHMLLVCGVYHPPRPTYPSNELMQYLTRKYMHAETHALLTKPLYFPNMKYLEQLSW